MTAIAQSQGMTILGAIYARQSETKEGSQSREDQVEELRRAAERLGIVVVEEIIEPESTSAYKGRGLNRPRWSDTLLPGLRQGRFQAVLVLDTSRLSRGGGPGYAPFVEAIEGAGLNLDKVVATAHGWVSEFELGIRATMDREEAKKIAFRASLIQRRRAEAGLPRTGGVRPFGYEPDLMTIRPAEAALIHEAAERVLLGETCWAITRTWNDRGIPSSGGKRWTSRVLARVLISPRVAGLRQHQGEVVADAVWPAILDRETWERLRVIIDRAATPRKTPIRKHLLSGLLHCGRCGGAMRARSRNKYACVEPRENGWAGSCGKCMIGTQVAEEDVYEMVAGTLLDPEALQRIIAAAPPSDRKERDLGVELRTLHAQREKLLDLYLDDKVDKVQYERRLHKVDAELADLQVELAKRAERPVLATVPTTEAELQDAWATNGVSWQRLVVEALFDRITVTPGRAKRPQDRLAYLPR